jgi:hypothetical protein
VPGKKGEHSGAPSYRAAEAPGLMKRSRS